MLSQPTPPKALGEVLDQLFKKWPREADLALARYCDLERVLTPLGQPAVRREKIVALSTAYLMCDDEKDDSFDISQLPYCGKQAQEIWDLFVLKRLDNEPKNKSLKAWAEWKRKQTY